MAPVMRSRGTRLFAGGISAAQDTGPVRAPRYPADASIIRITSMWQSWTDKGSRRGRPTRPPPAAPTSPGPPPLDNSADSPRFSPPRPQGNPRRSGQRTPGRGTRRPIRPRGSRGRETAPSRPRSGMRGGAMRSPAASLETRCPRAIRGTLLTVDPRPGPVPRCREPS